MLESLKWLNVKQRLKLNTLNFIKNKEWKCTTIYKRSNSLRRSNATILVEKQ